jgi:outer membrane protein assembly factor BamB
LILCLSACAAQVPEETPTLQPTENLITTPTAPALDSQVIHYLADPQRTASYAFTAVRNTPDIKWQKKMTAAASLGSPVYGDGVLYVSSQNGRLYAIDAETGEQIWSSLVGQLPASVAVTNDRIFVNDLNNTTNALRRDSGKTVWSVPIKGSGWGAPLVVDGTVYVVSERAAYALESETGSVLWEVETGNHRGFIGSPAFSDGILCFGAGGNYFALEAATGKELWKLKGETWFYGSAIFNGLIYVGNDDGKLHAYDLQSGAERWHSETKGTGWSAPAVADGVVYAGNVDQHLYAFDAASGQELWSFETVDWATSDPIVSDGVLYFGVGNHDNREGPRPLYALDAKTGEELWQFEADARLMTAAAVSDGTVYIVTIKGRLYALK